MSAKRILVLGGTCGIGRALKAKFGDRVVATRRGKGPADWPRFDASTDEVAPLVERHGPFGHAIVLFGETNPEKCFRDPAGTRELNVVRTVRILDDLAKHGISSVFTSTANVFDGRKGSYGESDPPNPETAYGRQKVEVERHMDGRPGSVVRLSRVVGTAPGDGTIFTSWLGEITATKTIRVASDNRLSPIHVDDVAEGLVRVAEAGLGGIHHLANQGMGRLEMLEALLGAWKAAGRRFDGKIETCRFADFPTNEPRPLDSTMVLSPAIAATGLRLLSVEEICARVVRAAL